MATECAIKLKLPSVSAAIWLAAAVLARRQANKLPSLPRLIPDRMLSFPQREIRETAEQYCQRSVNNARISQWCNADHPQHTYNYLRAVGKNRRLTAAGECGGHREQPDLSSLSDEPVLHDRGDGKPMTLGELVEWATREYPRLIQPRLPHGSAGSLRPTDDAPQDRAQPVPTTPAAATESATNQTIGNIGLFYVCYQLSRKGWNVMPTSRNAKGVDILTYSLDAQRKWTIQVKALSRRSPAPLGGNLNHLFADFVVICRHVQRDTPECFVLTSEEVRKLAARGEKGGKVSYWLQPRQYESDEFREKWARIGSGLS